jgi:hypothetical protein
MVLVVGTGLGRFFIGIWIGGIVVSGLMGSVRSRICFLPAGICSRVSEGR